MKIGLIASIWIRVPPLGFGFGAQEYLAYHLAEGLVKKGHDVTIFTTGDAKTSARINSPAPRQIIDLKPSDNKIKDTFELINLSNAYQLSDKFDIIHNHLLPYGLLFTEFSKTPTVHTLHHQIYHVSDTFLYNKFRNQNFISISNSQRNIMPDLNYVSTVHNGIDTDYFKFKQKPDGEYLLYYGRLKKYKGIHTAIMAAKSLGIKLIIATPDITPAQSDFEEVKEYWYKDIKPQLNESIVHVGEIRGKEKIKLLQDARALILPVEREEPFGMTVIEAMSAGTPVIAYAKGAMSELIIDGKTGYLIRFDDKDKRNFKIDKSGIEGLKLAINSIYSAPGDTYLTMRSASRESVEANFTVQKMVDAYEKVYEKFRK